MRGTMGSLKCPEFKHVDFGFGSADDFVHLDKPGAVPWLIALRRNKQRFGPLVLPSLGLVPTLVRPTVDVWIHGAPAQEVLQGGITLSGYELFLGSPEGARFHRDSSIALLVPAGAWVFLPAAFLYHVVYYKAPEKRENLTRLTLTCASC